MDLDRFRRFLPHPPPLEGESVEVDLRDGRAPVTVCPTCGGTMAVERLDLVDRVARLACPGCGLRRARWLPVS